MIKIRSTFRERLITLCLVMTSIVMPVFAVDQTDLSVKVHEYTPLAADTSKAGTLDSSSQFNGLFKASSYKDIGGSTSKKSIVKLTALGLLSKDASGLFGPNATMTGYDALRMLSSMAGRGPAIDASVVAGALGGSNKTTKLLYNNVLLKDARTNGIVLPSEEFGLSSPITKEQFAAFLRRSIGVPATTGSFTALNGLSDGKDITQNLRSEIDPLVQMGIIRPNSNNQVIPKGQVTKGMGAQILDNYLVATPTAQGTATDFGVVVGRTSKLSNQFGNLVSTGVVFVKKLDGTLTSIKTTNNQVQHTRSDVVVYKNGMVGSTSLLTPGDEIQWYTKNGAVQFAEVLNSQTILNKMNEAALANKLMLNYVYNFGNVISKSVEQDKIRLRVRHYDGEIVDILVQKNSPVYSDLLIQKTGKVGGIESLKVGDSFEYLTKDDQYVVYAALKNITVKKNIGTIRSLKAKTDGSEARLVLTDYKNQVKEYPLGSFSRVSYGTVPASTSEFKVGQDVVIYVANGYIIKSEISDASENPGYIPEGGKVRMGDITELYSDGIGLKLTSGAEENYTFDSSTVIRRNGQIIALKDLREGDRLKLSFDDILKNHPSLVEVEGVTRVVKQLYKGDLFGIDNNSGNLVLKNISYLKNMNWSSDDTYSKEVNFDSDTRFYLGQNSISSAELYKKYKGSTLYLAVQDSYGSEKAVQVTVKSGSETNFFDKVVKLDQTLLQMEFKNKVNVNIGKGTIVVKDGRIIPYNNLQIGDSAMVVSSPSSSGQQAQVVSVQGSTKNYFSNLHFGSIETVGPNAFTLKYYSKAYDNRFSTIADLPLSKEFTLNNESAIVLLNPDKTKTNLTYADLFNGKYAYSETIDNTSTKGLRNKRYYTYLVEDDNGQVLAMNLRRKGPFLNLPIDDMLNKESLIAEKMNDTAQGFRFTRGIYTEKDTTWNRLKLTASHDWSDLKQQWIANSQDTYTTYDNAIVIKNNKVITADDLQAGDYLFIWRSVEEGLVIFVDNN